MEDIDCGIYIPEQCRECEGLVKGLHSEACNGCPVLTNE